MNRRGGLWIAITGVLVLVAAHRIIMFYVASHVIVSAAVVGGVIVLIVFTHLGLLVPLYSVLRKRRRP